MRLVTEKAVIDISLVNIGSGNGIAEVCLTNIN